MNNRGSTRSTGYLTLAGLVLLALAAVLWLGIGRGGGASSAGGGSLGHEPSKVVRQVSEAGSDGHVSEAVLGASIAGRVLTPDARPIGDARVCAIVASLPPSKYDLGSSKCTVSRLDGSYRVGGLGSERYRVAAGAHGYQHAHHVSPSTEDGLILSADSRLTGIDIVLPPGGFQIEGRVTDVSGGGVEGALVTQETPGRWGIPEPAGVPAVSMEDGRFEMWVGEGQLTLAATAAGYTTARDVGPAPGHYFDLGLIPEAILEGVVVDAATGEPVEGARVYPSGDWGQRARESVLSSAAGKFRLPGLLPGRYKPYAEGSLGVGMLDVSVELGFGETADGLVIRIHPALYVQGRVVTKDGEPCEHGRVSMTDTILGTTRFQSLDSHGGVTVGGLLSGTYDVRVWCQGYTEAGQYDPVLLDKEAVTGQEWLVVRGGTVSGRVESSDGKMVHGVRVAAKLADGGIGRDRLWLPTELDGTFKIGGLNLDKYLVMVDVSETEGYVEPTAPYLVNLADQPEIDDVVIVLSEGASIAGTVLDPDGQPVGGAVVRAVRHPVGVDARPYVAADDGSFRIRGLHAGTYNLIARRSDREELDLFPEERALHAAITVRTGEAAYSDVVLGASEGGSITGVVSGVAGEPLGRVFVSVHRETVRSGVRRGAALREARHRAGMTRPLLVESDGSFVITGLSSGSYTVLATAQDGGEATAEGVETGDNIALQIKPGGSVSGSVVADDGSPIRRFSLTLEDRAAGSSVSESYLFTNRFRVTGLASGTYRLVAKTERGVSRLDDVRITSDAETDGIVLRVGGRGRITGRVVGWDSGEPLSGFLVTAHASGAKVMIGRDKFEPGSQITGDDGGFRLDDAPSGKVQLVVLAHKGADVAYGNMGTTAFVVANETTDVGDILLLRSRIAENQAPGTLGFTVMDRDPMADEDEREISVASIVRGGPADGTGLRVGDVVVAIDGQDIRGPRAYMFGRLATVPPGVTVELQLARASEKIAITAVERG